MKLGETMETTRRLLGTITVEYGAEEQIPNTVLYDAVCAALFALLPWAPNRSVVDFTGDGVVTRFPMPTDVYSIEAVEVQNTLIEKFTLAPRASRKVSTDFKVPDWMEWPAGMLSLSRPISGNITVYYASHYRKPNTENDLNFDLQVANHVMPGLLYYSAGYALMREATTSARIRQFNLRSDSGTPVDNPLAEHAEKFFSLFHGEMSHLPKYQWALQ